MGLEVKALGRSLALFHSNFSTLCLEHDLDRLAPLMGNYLIHTSLDEPFFAVMYHEMRTFSSLKQ